MLWLIEEESSFHSQKTATMATGTAVKECVRVCEGYARAVGNGGAWLRLLFCCCGSCVAGCVIECVASFVSRKIVPNRLTSERGAIRADDLMAAEKRATVRRKLKAGWHLNGLKTKTINCSESLVTSDDGGDD